MLRRCQVQLASVVHGAGGGVQPWKPYTMVGRVMCSVHGRQRRQQFMEAMPNNQWKCPPNDQCSSNQQNNKIINQNYTKPSENYGGGMAGDGGQDGRKEAFRIMCSEHNVNRLSHLLVANSDGKTFRCRPEDPCRIKAMCSVHLKQRQLQFMKKTDDGAYVCCAPNECGTFQSNNQKNSPRMEKGW